ncbi:MAG: small subunit ribosomal protein S17 [Parcubacteria group bacterium Gr01-1014_3]|nr:MAG: small subunit ribosomal protein S17 [Parcubacteria group bacterium Gr01-1014_3]
MNKPVQEKPKMGRKLSGVVVSDKMRKTVVVQVDHTRKHPKYLKYYKLSTRLKAHDEKGEYKTGDQVTIQETRPISRDKRWVVIGKIVSTNPVAEVPVTLQDAE